MLDLAALFIGTIATALIAITVFSKNGRSITSKLFLGLAISLIGWSVTTYFSLHTTNDQQTLFWQRPIMFFVVLQNTFFFLLVRVFPRDNFKLFKKKKYIIAALYSAVVSVLAASPLLFIDFKDGAPIPGPAMPLFLIHALIFAIGGIGYLIYRFKKARGRDKAQLTWFLAGTVLLYTLVPIANFVFPIAFKSTFLLMLSPLYSLIFAALFAYGIIAKRLFDVRATVARTVAYVLSLGVIGVIYGAIISGLLSVVSPSVVSEKLERIFYVGLALATATAFPYTKRFFDRITKKLFYQDAYDSSMFLAQTNRLIVGQIELDQLLKGIAAVIEENLKTSYCVFVIRETAYEEVRIVGTEKHKFDQQKIKELRSLTPHIHRKIFVADELKEGEDQIGDLLKSLDVSVLLRLVASVDYDIEGVGYLVLGSKKNGTIYSGQDIQVLEILANEMVIAVQNALRFEEIEKFNITLQEKVDDATKKLRSSNEKLKQLDETKDEFISMASHQLRTPLTSVKGYLSMVLEGDAGEVAPMQQKLLDQAYVSSQRMVYLIADLLNVSRLRTGKFIIDPIESNLADVVEGEIGQLKETAAGRGLELTYTKPANFPKLYLDETKIRQVIMNFTDNAIYYTPRGGHIEVKLEDKGESIELTVNDDGMGVPKTEQPHLFSKFYRAGNAQKARPDGTGLGLFMAKKVVIAQGGNIIFRSTEGKGSTFGFAFPKDKLQPPAAASVAPMSSE